MNICTSFCLLPVAVSRRGKNLWVDGPFGPVEICSVRRSIGHYRGRTLTNGSVRIYLRHILAEIRRILSTDSGWRRKGDHSEITNPTLFYESIFRPNERERDRIRWWAGREDGC